MDLAWKSVTPYKESIINYVTKGGHYVGICMGGYLAGQRLNKRRDPKSGYGLLRMADSNAIEYTRTKGADTKNDKDFLATIIWKGEKKRIYY